MGIPGKSAFSIFRVCFNLFVPLFLSFCFYLFFLNSAPQGAICCCSLAAGMQNRRLSRPREKRAPQRNSTLDDSGFLLGWFACFLGFGLAVWGSLAEGAILPQSGCGDARSATTTYGKRKNYILPVKHHMVIWIHRVSDNHAQKP